ncbi:MAG TPA: winged helix-turn-helix domain-containing protein [Nitrososphaeraceae archaeon]|nr:winged helix-turn-helix domain-containing protein [Nitrososphaeraceae archaeon]
MTGETQLRARLTRIKILRAIAERNGSAGFSEIRNATGLSTGSIYYHLERMEDYVTKDSKQYKITEEGLELLREIDKKSVVYPTYNKEEETSTSLGVQTDETVRQPRPVSQLIRDHSILFLIIPSLFFVSVALYLNINIIFPNIFIENKIVTNPALMSTFSTSILVIVSFSIILKRQMLTSGYTRMMSL